MSKKLLTAVLLAAIASSFSLLPLCSPPADARAYTTYEQALEDLDESRYEAADEKLRKVIADSPNSAEAHADMARLHMNRDDKALMLAEVNKAIELDDKLCRAYAFRAYLDFRLGRKQQGFEDSKKAVDLYTVNPHDWSIWVVLKNRARAYEMVGALEEAKADRERVALFEMLDQAGKFRESGRLPESMKRIDEALLIDPLHADLWFLRGVVNANMMKFWEAVADYSRALRFSPKSTMIYYFRGDSYEQLGKHQQAVDDYTRVINAGQPLVAYRFVCETGRLRNEILRDDTVAVSINDVRFLRAQALYTLGKFNAAVKDLDYIISSDKTDDKALTRRAEIVASMGKSDDSIKDYSRAIEANKQHWKVYSDRAEAYLRVGKDEQAIADYTQVIKLAPDDPGSYVMRAGAYKSIGDYEAAINDFTTAIGKQPVDDLLLERADCYREMHRYDEAFKDLDEALKLDPSNATLVSSLRAKVFQERGDDDKARDELLELESKRQQDLHKNDGLYWAVGLGLTLVIVGCVWLLVRFLRNKHKSKGQ